MGDTPKATNAPAGKSPAVVPGVEEEPRSRIRIKVRAYDYKLADQSARQIVDTAIRSGARVHGPVPLPTEKKRYTVNRATFAKKDARDQYEIRVHKRLLDITSFAPKTIDALMALQLPSGVDVEMKT